VLLGELLKQVPQSALLDRIHALVEQVFDLAGGIGARGSHRCRVAGWFFVLRTFGLRGIKFTQGFLSPFSFIVRTFFVRTGRGLPVRFRN
jgi:hypothetical protein